MPDSIDPEGSYPTKEDFDADFPLYVLYSNYLSFESIQGYPWIMSLAKKLAITDVDLKNKRVLIRVSISRMMIDLL